MSTTNTTSSLTEQIADLMRHKPAHGAPEHVRAAWLARKVELLAAVEAEQEANERTCSEDATEQMIEAAERDGERPPAPAWHRGAYPTIQMVTKAGEPVRSFERFFGALADVWSCYLLCQDVHTAHGVVRSPTVVQVDGPNQGATPAQARALAASLLAAADAAQGVAP
jgi:hypothetical protein